MEKEHGHTIIDSLIQQDLLKNNQPLIDLPIINPMPAISGLGNVTGLSSFLANPLQFLKAITAGNLGLISTGLLTQEPGHGKTAQFTPEGRDSLAFENLLKELENIEISNEN
mgnify:FL=1